MKIWFIFILVLFLIVGCTSQVTDGGSKSSNERPPDTVPTKEVIENVDNKEIPSEPLVVKEKEPQEQIINDIVKEKEVVSEELIQTTFYNDTRWMRIEMQDVITNKTFTLDSLQGENIIVESFSKYCYNCGEQRIKLQDFIANNNSLRLISVNTDFNAKKEEVIEHVDRYEYNWTFVLASKEFRDSIIKQFGKDIVKYDNVPLVLVCEDLSAYLLADGLKGPFQLNEALKKCS